MKPIEMSTTQPLVEALDVSFNHRDRHILQSVNLAVRAGEIVTLIGPNGAGKTTLLKIILGLLQPSGGRIQRAKGLRIGYMPQKLNLNSNLPITVQRFLRLTCKDNVILENILDEMSIQHLTDTDLGSVSGGELQRVLLARAMLHRPDLLVLDEPAQGVDIAGQGALYTLINQLKHRYHCGVLMVSHDLHLVMSTTDVVICLNQHICCEGHPDSVSSDPAYLSLFGKSAASALAVYTHHHDHKHDLQGNIIEHNCEGKK